ncbi:hypothetical protein EXIGLDRAFT_831911 [Exidia glandulosa HHB12029]|uniref:Conidiation protein 6 n=1 Tax=Exidia glandulosa HHB12029 TaxID=1314781 RepID=A0A165M8P4_EXIGL|nr:hypothetical protein EXIGLDRAFT_831911 [Exidia glandulosa HHB12029]
MSHEENVIRGHKAALSNPRVSDEAKEHSAAVISEFEKSNNATTTREGEIHEHRVLGGYKATLNNPNTSDEAKQKAEAVLEEHGVRV